MLLVGAADAALRVQGARRVGAANRADLQAGAFQQRPQTRGKTRGDRVVVGGEFGAAGVDCD